MPSADVMTPFAAAGSVALGVAALGYVLLDRFARSRRKTVARLLDVDRREVRRATTGGRAILSRLTVRLGRLVAPRDELQWADLRRQLVHAGHYQRTAPLQYSGVRLLSSASGAGAAGAAAGAAGLGGLNSLLWVAAGFLVGFLIPSTVLASQVKNRQRLLARALPDALDIMVMCVESGASLSAAIDWVTDEIRAVHPVLASELEIVRREVQLGLTAGEGFRHLADRSGVEDVGDLAATIAQSERHGASVGKALRSYADAARLARQMWAEEMSQKAAVKIVFPTLLCIFPAMFTVLLGPAAFQMAKLFAR